MDSRAQQVGRLSGSRVLCVGDVMLDEFVYGDVTRISPEAPIPVLHTRRRESMLGGAGNAVRNLVALGAEVQFLSVVGDDQAAEQVETLCGKLDGLRLTLVRDPARTTSTKTRFIAHGQQLLRADAETTTSVNDGIFAELRAAFEGAVREARAVLFCDYGKGVLDGSRASELIRPVREVGCPVIVDPKGFHFGRYRGATLIKPNLKELATATAMPVDTERQQVEASRSLLEQTAAQYVLITRGPDGMLLVEPDIEPRSFSSLAREVYDVTGAGDTVAAVLAAALAADISINTAVEIANAAAGVVVGKLGTAVATPCEIVRQLDQTQ